MAWTSMPFLRNGRLRSADIAELRNVLARAQGFSVLAEHDRAGTRQDLITAIP